MPGDPYTKLVSRIRSGEYPTGSRLPPERSLSEELGTHRTTIRRAIARLASEGLLEVRTGCRPIVRLPGDSRSLALLMSGTASARPFSQIITGVEKAAAAGGFRLLFSNTIGVTPEQARLTEIASLKGLLEHPVAGVVIWAYSPEDTRPYVEQLVRRGCPVVAIDRRIGVGLCDFVGIDNAEAVSEVVQHIVRHGHQRVLFVTGHQETTSTALEREKGFLEAMRACNLPAGEDAVFRVPDAPAEEWLSPILRGPERPTALVAVNDWFAFHVKRAVEALGMRIPSDVCVTGFDDLEDELLATPFLTTVRQPFERMGRQAVRLLRRRLEQADAPKVTMLLDTLLVERSSTIEAARMGARGSS